MKSKDEEVALRSSATTGAGQPPLPLLYRAKRTPRTTTWAFRGHVGYYAAGWQCEHCGGFWDSFLALLRDPRCN